MIKHRIIPVGPDSYCLVISHVVGKSGVVLGVVRVERGVVVAMSRDLAKYL